MPAIVLPLILWKLFNVVVMAFSFKSYSKLQQMGASGNGLLANRSHFPASTAILSVK
jgi:hypothetical protein